MLYLIRTVIICLLTALVIVIIVSAVYVLSEFDGKIGVYVELNPPDVTIPLPPSPSILGNFTKAAAVSNGKHCATIGRQILEKGGSAVDALIAVMLCDGVACFQYLGIGGGFLMTIYTKENNSADVLNARETAPAAARKDMYKDNRSASKYGALAIAVPGQLKGLQEAWKKYGKLPWAELFEPTIKMCEEGFLVEKPLERMTRAFEVSIRKNKALSDILIINGTVVKEGDKIKLPKLGQTMRVIAESSIMADEFYKGSLTEGVVKDIQNGGGIITEEDLNNYEVEWMQPIVSNLSEGVTMYTVPPPGSGVVLAFIMRVLDGFVQNATNDVEMTQRITETFKYAYGGRSGLGDPRFYDISQVMQKLTSDDYIAQTRKKISDTMTFQNPKYYGSQYAEPEDHGTGNMAVLAPNGDAAVATSTIDLIFGSRFMSESTGILFNDQMDDFSSMYGNYFGVPPSPANFIHPGKRPLTSISTAIYVDRKGDVRLVLGSAGGTKITTSCALVAIHNLWYKRNIKEAVDFKRIHHQLEPMRFEYEYGTLREIAKGMAEIGHVIRRFYGGSVITAIAKNGDKVQGNVDFRRNGGMDGW